MDDFHWPVRVYYEDTDSGGVVYHANYLKFMERARSEWLRAHGLEQDVLIEEHGVIFTVVSAQLDFLRPARFNQELTVAVRPVETRRVSVTVAQDIHEVTEGGEHGQLLCRGNIKIACVDAASLRPRPFPENVRREIFSDR